MSGLLLDTTALIWCLSGSPHLGPASRSAIQSADRVHFSAVSAVEVSLKVTLGRLPAPPRALHESAREAGLRELPLDAVHAHTLLDLPSLARHDPFDRMLAAQAVCGGLTLLTSDSILLREPDIRTLDART